jgi:murein DD-endopeptidase MepM/ murein hydrolase activator NlpD
MKSYLWSKKQATKDGSAAAGLKGDGTKLHNENLNAGWQYQSSGSAHRAYDVNDSKYSSKNNGGKGGGLKLRAHRTMKVLALNDGVKNPPSASPGSNKPSNWVLLSVGKYKVENGKKVKQKKGDRKTLYLQHLSPGLSVKVGQVLKPGDLIGEAGITGNTSGPHIHIACMWGTVDRESDRYLYLSRGDKSGKNKGKGSVVWDLDGVLRIGKNRKDPNSKSKGW